MQIKYTGFRDRPHEERQARFQNACRDGRSEIVSRRGGGPGAPGTEARAGHLLRGGCRGPGRFRTPRVPELSGAPSHFLLGIQNAKADTGGPRVLARRRFPVTLGGGYVSQTRLANRRQTKQGKVMCRLE